MRTPRAGHGGRGAVLRNTTTRDRHRRIIARGLAPSPFGPKPPCYRCSEPIDYEAHHLDPLSFTIDHLKALANGAPTRSTTSCPPTGSATATSPTRTWTSSCRPGPPPSRSGAGGPLPAQTLTDGQARPASAPATPTALCGDHLAGSFLRPASSYHPPACDPPSAIPQKNQAAIIVLVDGTASGTSDNRQLPGETRA